MKQTLLCLLLLANLSSLHASDAFQFRGDNLSTRFAAGQERTVLTGNVRITSGSLVIQADTVELWGPSYRSLLATGAVTVVDNNKNLTIRARSMNYDRILKSSRFEGLCEVDDPGRNLTVRSGVFDYDEQADRLSMQSGVRILKGSLICRSDFAVYDRQAQSLELTGLPSVWKKQDVYRAGTIRVDLDSENVWLDGGVTGTITPEEKKP